MVGGQYPGAAVEEFLRGRCRCRRRPAARNVRRSHLRRTGWSARAFVPWIGNHRARGIGDLVARGHRDPRSTVTQR